MPDQAQNQEPSALSPTMLHQHFEQTKAEMDALPADALKTIAVDITEAVMSVSGCYPKLAPFREAIVRLLPGTSIRYFDDLPRYVGSLHHAHRMHGLLAEQEVPIAEWAAELAENHELLSTTAQLVAQQGLMNGTVLPSLRPRNTHVLLINNTLKLVELLRLNWPQIDKKTVLSPAVLDGIEADAVRLTTAIGEREQRIAAITASAETRKRAYTLFVRAYSEVRRAIGYLRWFEGDADIYAPPLSNHSKRKPAEGEEPSEAETAAVKPAATDGMATGAPANGATPVAAPAGPNAAPFTR